MPRRKNSREQHSKCWPFFDAVGPPVPSVWILHKNFDARAPGSWKGNILIEENGSAHPEQIRAFTWNDEKERTNRLSWHRFDVEPPPISLLSDHTKYEHIKSCLCLLQFSTGNEKIRNSNLSSCMLGWPIPHPYFITDCEIECMDEEHHVHINYT